MVLNIRAKPSGVAQGLKKTHDDDTFLATTIVPPFRQPPKVQTLITTK
jgi:hypothetical protein